MDTSEEFKGTMLEVMDEAAERAYNLGRSTVVEVSNHPDGLLEYRLMPEPVESEVLDFPFAWLALQEIEQTAKQMMQDLEACMRAETFGDARNVALVNAGRRSLWRAFDAFTFGLEFARRKHDAPEAAPEAETNDPLTEADVIDLATEDGGW